MCQIAHLYSVSVSMTGWRGCRFSRSVSFITYQLLKIKLALLVICCLHYMQLTCAKGLTCCFVFSIRGRLGCCCLARSGMLVFQLEAGRFVCACLLFQSVFWLP